PALPFRVAAAPARAELGRSPDGREGRRRRRKPHGEDRNRSPSRAAAADPAVAALGPAATAPAVATLAGPARGLRGVRRARAEHPGKVGGAAVEGAGHVLRTDAVSLSRIAPRTTGSTITHRATRPTVAAAPGEEVRSAEVD